MPELPEVEVILRQLRPCLQGSVISCFHIKRPDIIRVGLSSHQWYIGSRISELERRGKSVIFTCEKEQSTRFLLAELGMTGLFLFQSASTGYEKHIHLTLSGHTHGAQMGIDSFGIKWSPIQYFYTYWAGLYQELNQYLYVNRGFGFMGFAGRIGIAPEITVFILKIK